MLLREFHDSSIGRHSGVLKTFRRIAVSVYLAGRKGNIQCYVANCVVCQQYKSSTLAPGGLPQPLPISDLVWDDISMDFIESLPKSEGLDTILMVVDRVSKYAHFICLQHPYTALTVATAFIREVVRLHGVPRSIVSNRDKVFMSNFWNELFKLQGTVFKRSTAYHP